MEIYRKGLPVVFLAAWPYIVLISRLLLIAIAISAGAAATWLPSFYIVLTIVLCGLNVYNALTYEGGIKRLATYYLAIKISHTAVCLGILVIAVMEFIVVLVSYDTYSIASFIEPLGIIAEFLFWTASSYGISAAVRLQKNGNISKAEMILYIIFSCMIISDVISAICLVIRAGSAEGSKGSV